MSVITTTYLEMTAESQLRPKKPGDARFHVMEAAIKQWEFNRFLYVLVGEPWAWRDKLSWSDERWKSYAESDATSTFVAYYDGSPAGYFELSRQGKEVELAYFGLAPRFIGRGLGGVLLTRAIEEAWRLDPTRIWVHTCSLDHPAALQNYLSRGMVVFKTEKKEANQAPGPAAPSGRGSF